MQGPSDSSLARDPGSPVRRAKVVNGTGVVWIVAVAIASILVFIELMGFRELVPPRSQTRAAMKALKAAVLLHAAEEGTLPASLQQLPDFAATDFPFVDGWQNPIAFRVEGDRALFQSLGGDGDVGGLNQDTDLVGVFALHDGQGAWSAPDVPWLVDPVEPAQAFVEPDP